MAGRLGLTLREYRLLETGELHITNDLTERIVDLCGWPRGWAHPTLAQQTPPLWKVSVRNYAKSQAVSPSARRASSIS